MHLYEPMQVSNSQRALHRQDLRQGGIILVPRQKVMKWSKIQVSVGTAMSGGQWYVTYLALCLQYLL